MLIPYEASDLATKIDEDGTVLLGKVIGAPAVVKTGPGLLYAPVTYTARLSSVAIPVVFMLDVPPVAIAYTNEPSPLAYLAITKLLVLPPVKFTPLNFALPLK